MRVKTVEMDGVTIQYSPLTIEQAEQYEAEPRPKEDEDARPLLYKIAMLGMNNAMSDGQPRWTIERIKKELDSVLVQAVWRGVLTSSGYDIKEPGETPAQS